ncbi:MAG: hypothetical protein U0401_25955 [Anaerolineae bacterium]
MARLTPSLQTGYDLSANHDYPAAARSCLPPPRALRPPMKI